LAVFLADGSGPSVGPLQAGEIGDGSYSKYSAFWFDTYSAWLGCDDAGPESCTIVISAYVWDESAQKQTQAYSQNATIVPCPALKGCSLQQFNFPTSFRQLSGLKMQAFVGNKQKMFFLDDLVVAWSNTSCQAASTRAQVPGK